MNKVYDKSDVTYIGGDVYVNAQGIILRSIVRNINNNADILAQVLDRLNILEATMENEKKE